MSSIQCKICGNNTRNRTHKVREMYFGTREFFNYLECSECGCLQLMNIPADLSQHYPENYFAFNQKFDSKLKSMLNKYRDQYALGKKNILGKILYGFLGSPVYIERLKIAGVKLEDKILDVGCGKGYLLHKMRESGFRNTFGTDAFISESIKYKNGLEIFKKSFFDINGEFDLIMMNHSLEHMEEPLNIFEHTSRLLKKDKYFIVRIPVADSYAWKHYGVNWSSLDAPRHLFLYTKKAIQLLCDKTGFELKYVTYDSRSWQFWGSEQYKRDIPLVDDRSYFINPDKSVFSKAEIQFFEEETKKLNNDGHGDQAGFYLKKK